MSETSTTFQLLEAKRRGRPRKAPLKPKTNNQNVDPADMDNPYGDEPGREADLNIIVQLNKVVTLGNKYKVTFDDDTQHAVDKRVASFLLKVNEKLKDKDVFQQRLIESYKTLMAVYKMLVQSKMFRA